MARTNAPKVVQTRPKLTDTQKKARRDRLLGLTNAIADANENIKKTMVDIAETHGR